MRQQSSRDEGPAIDTSDLAVENAELRAQLIHVQEQVRALTESEGRFRSLFESSPLALWEEDMSAVRDHMAQLHASGVTDFRTYFDRHPQEVAAIVGKVRVLNVNEATVELCGVKDKAALIGPLRPDAGDGARRFFADQLCALWDGRSVYEQEVPTLTPAGELLLSIKVAIADGYEQTWSRVWLSMSDVTEHRRAERENAQLTIAHEMIATLRHEINNPLQGVIGYAEHLLSKLPPDGSYADMVQRIFRGAERIDDLVQRLGSLERIETKTYLGDDQMVDLERSMARRTEEPSRS